jgi:hypothetical protein
MSSLKYGMNVLVYPEAAFPLFPIVTVPAGNMAFPIVVVIVCPVSSPTPVIAVPVVEMSTNDPG